MEGQKSEKDIQREIQKNQKSKLNLVVQHLAWGQLIHTVLPRDKTSQQKKIEYNKNWYVQTFMNTN